MHPHLLLSRTILLATAAAIGLYAAPVFAETTSGQGDGASDAVDGGTPDPEARSTDGASDEASALPELSNPPEAPSGAGEADPLAAPVSLAPPNLLEYVEAEYPEAAQQAGLEAVVLSEIDIDETGKVVDVRVVDPVGHGFDEAAVAAMKRFVFEPALKDGAPVPARITYRYRFFLQAAAPAGTDSAAGLPATLAGRLLSMDDQPIEGGAVRLVSPAPEEGAAEPITQDAAPPAPSPETASDDQGAFRLADIPPGAYRIEIVAPGYLPLEIDEQISAGETREVIYRLELEDAAYEVVVRGKRPMREVTRRVVTAREITKIPGTGGDALRAVQNLPGLARTSFGGGQLIVRGSSPADTVYAFGSLPAPMLYHFGDLTSVINSDMIEAIDFYPGNFSVRYGRATGGVVDVTLRSPKTDRLHGYIDVDVWDAGALLEGPITENWSFAISARRSYIDAVLKGAKSLLGDDIFTVAPRYYDFQVVADYHPGESDHLRLFFYGTDDKMVMDWDDDGSLLGTGFGAHLYTYQAQAEWRHRFSDTLSNQLNIGFGYWGGGDNFGDIKEEWDVWPLLIRDELTFAPSEKVTLRVGTDTELRWGKIEMKVPGDYGSEGEPGYGFSANDTLLTFDGRRFMGQPGAYAELELNVLPKTQLIYGVRGDYHSVIDSWSADPRMSVRHDLLPKTTLKAGVGLFHQPGDFAETDRDYGNPELKPQRAIHYSVGFEQRFLENFELNVEGFYKDLRRVVTPSDDIVERDGELVPERFDNDAEGRVYGMEAELKHHPTDRFFGWITYTLMRSERTKDGVTRLFDYDQTHILTVVGSVHVGWGVDIGLRFRLVSGNPHTPVLGSSYDADSDMYNPIYGKVNSARMPLFHQLDLRVDKKWQWKHLALTTYLDVQNVYNYKNTEFYVHSFDYKEKAKIQGLPIIPSIGLKLEY